MGAAWLCCVGVGRRVGFGPGIEFDPVAPSQAWRAMAAALQLAPLPALFLRPCSREWLHWMVTNIPSGGTANQGHEVTPWRGPSPPVGTHRYVFLLFEQVGCVCGSGLATARQAPSSSSVPLAAPPLTRSPTRSRCRRPIPRVASPASAATSPPVTLRSSTPWWAPAAAVGRLRQAEVCCPPIDANPTHRLLAGRSRGGEVVQCAQVRGPLLPGHQFALAVPGLLC